MEEQIKKPLKSQTAKEFQKSLANLIKTRLNTIEVKSEWRAFEDMPYQYSPRVDIAVGPISDIPGVSEAATYNQLLDKDKKINKFLQEIYHFHVDNCLNEITPPGFDILVQKNQNARCFLAIEIENRNSKKHIMGSIINAASLGRVGIGIAYNESVERAFVRIMRYLEFLKSVEKNSYDTTNFLIVTKEQIERILDR